MIFNHTKIYYENLNFYFYLKFYFIHVIERFGPIMNHYYHKSCFKCITCHTLLELKTFCANGDDLKDKNVYCQRHAPKPTKSKKQSNGTPSKNKVCINYVFYEST